MWGVVQTFKMKYLFIVTLSLINMVAMADSSITLNQQVFLYAEKGDIDRIETARMDGVSIDISNEYGETLLMHAAVSKRLDVVKYLINKKANIHAKDNYGFTVVDILESNIRRSGKNEEKMVETMKSQGLTNESIDKLLGKSNPGFRVLTEDDRLVWQQILDYIKDIEKKNKINKAK